MNTVGAHLGSQPVAEVAYAGLDLGAPAELPASSAPIACLDGSFGLTGPAGAYALHVSDRDNLQVALDTFKVVRLEAGDYRGALPQIRLSSGQRLFGMPGELVTLVPTIVVAGGTTDALLSGLDPVSLDFPAEGGVTQANCFTKLYNLDVNVTNASLENNLFLHLYNAKLSVDTRSGGYLRNNRFIRVKVQGAIWPGISLRGDTGRQSSGNVWLWYNLLAPWGDGIYVENQADTSFVGLDAEAWNSNNQGTHAMLTTGPTGMLRVFGPVGAQGGGTRQMGIFDIAADAFKLYSSSLDGNTTQDLIFRSQNQRSAVIHADGQLTESSPTGARVRGFEGADEDVHVLGKSMAAGRLTTAAQDALRQLFVAPTANRAGQAWERPVFGAIADPAGPNWNTNLGNQPDATDYIQGLINTNGIAQLPAGIFYISRSLQLADGQGVIGAGEGQTAIVAKNNRLDMIVSNQHCDGGVQICGYHITLADLTLQGGRNGIHWDAAGAGVGAQIGGGNAVSHVTFRNMAEAGIFVDGIMGLDNNYFDHLAFYQNVAGLKQRSNWTGSGEPGQSYLDKNVFFHSQFVANGRGLDLQAARQNTLNAWINSRFQDNTVYAAEINDSVATLFANTDFINNAGSPSIVNNWQVGFVSAYFRADSLGRMMLGDGVTCEGCVFERGSSSNATMFAPNGDRVHSVFLFNSRSVNMPLGPVNAGLLANTALGADPQLSNLVVTLRGGTPRVGLTGTPDPKPELLWGASYR